MDIFGVFVAGHRRGNVPLAAVIMVLISDGTITFVHRMYNDKIVSLFGGNTHNL